MKYKLQDLIDMEHFQNLQDRLNGIYSFPPSIIDNDGNILTATAWQDICTQFHRKNKDCEKLCIQSDLYIKDHIHEANPAVTYRCPHGLMDNAMPIIIDGFHYGNFFTGQFFLEEPDMEFFRAQAKKYQFDEDAYLKAVKQVPIWTQKQLNSYLFFIKGLIAIISESGLKNLKEVENRKLIESKEKKHRSILKSAMDGYWLTDTEGQLLEVNDAYCHMSGYTENELLTMRIPDLEAIENPQLAAKHMQKIISQGSDRFESIHRRKDGTVFSVEVSTQFRPVGGGQCVCFLRDITDRKSAEQDLINSRAQLRILINTIPDLVWLKDPNGIYLGCNQKFENFFGAKESAIVGKTDYDFIDKDLADFFRDHDRKAIEQDGPSINEEWLTFSDDGYHGLFETIKTPMTDQNGKLIGVLGIARDITERKEAEERQHNSTQLLIDMGNIAKIGGWEHDLTTDEITWTHETYNIVEIESGPVPGPEEHLSYYKPKDRKIIEDAYRLSVETGEQFDLKLQASTAKGRSIWVRVVGRPEYKDGACVKIKGILQNITEQKKVEMQLQQAQKMESVGRLAGGVAHDFNNALSVILGFTDFAMEEADPKSQLYEDLTEILKAAKRSADITRQLLAFARKQIISPKILDLNETIESMLKMLQRLIGEDIDLSWLPGANLLFVKMDPSQIDQILVNLCVNSRDAIENVGKITIETNTVIFDSAYCDEHTGFIPGEYVLLAVSDNGVGMDRDIQDSIFEPFFTTKDVNKGTGLGLATVYGIVKQNNGFINVYSEPDKGTTIKIYLSRHKAQGVEIHGENIAKIPIGRGETILLVEDDLSILKLVEKILKEFGYSVLTACTPIEAIDLAKSHSSEIHLLITDVIMPEMNGRELSEQLQSQYPDLKCMFMSGYTANAIAHHGVLDEGMDFIQKPFSKTDLAKIVKKVLDEN